MTIDKITVPAPKAPVPVTGIMKNVSNPAYSYETRDSGIPYWIEVPDEATQALVERARAKGIHVLVANYRGGYDEAEIDCEGCYDAEGNPVEWTDGVEHEYSYPDGTTHKWTTPDCDELAWWTVQRHFGGFSGAGDGNSYWGTVQLRLDTLETREVFTGYLREEETEIDDAAWR